MSAFDWWRSWHGAPTDMKWPVIAARAGVKVGVVNSVAWALMDYASQQKVRGTVAGFDTESYAVYTGFPQSEIDATIQAMTDKGVIVDGKLANWEKRQPKREDDSSERVARLREMKRSVTQCNADVTQDNEKEGDVTFSSLSLSPSVSVLENESVLTDNFDIFQRFVESKGVNLSGAADIAAMNKIVKMGATLKDLENGYSWLIDNNSGKTVRYVSSLVGPTKTAMAKRLQGNGNGSHGANDAPKKPYTDAAGNVVWL